MMAMKRMSPGDRFWPKVDKTPNCWEWTGRLNNRGYGSIFVGGKVVGAHVFAYTELVGPVPDGCELDHLCKNRRCVNPAHLEAVTHRENTRRGAGFAGRHARATHCPKGHLYDEDNTCVNYLGHRVCRTCRRAYYRCLRARQRSQTSSDRRAA